MKALNFAPRALADLAAIHAYISSDSLAAASKVSRAIVEAAARLKLFPHLGRSGTVKGTLEFVVPKLPFIVVYIVTKDAIEVVAIVHVMQGERRRYTH